jgi:hypothetical protein
MEKNDFYNQLVIAFNVVVDKHNLRNENVEVFGKVLTAEEAIGNPKRKNFPIVVGKEKLMEATFRGSIGQAFTDMPINFSGTIDSILNLELNNNGNRAIFISTLNAVTTFLKLSDKSIHCKDDEPEECSEALIAYIKENYDSPKISLIGFQPSMLENLSNHFEMRIIDLDKEHIGKKEFNILIEDGNIALDDILQWGDLILATGSTIVNGSIANLIDNNNILFYGTTICGAASLLNIPRFCHMAK